MRFKPRAFMQLLTAFFCFRFLYVIGKVLKIEQPSHSVRLGAYGKGFNVVENLAEFQLEIPEKLNQRRIVLMN
jgi:hypothetical protein